MDAGVELRALKRNWRYCVLCVERERGGGEESNNEAFGESPDTHEMDRLPAAVLDRTSAQGEWL